MQRPFLMRPNFGKTMAKIRIDYDLTQKDLAAMLTNYGSQTVSAIERGERRPTAEFIKEVVRALSLPPELELALIQAREQDLRNEFFGRYKGGEQTPLQP